jgi:hypothetical protein
LFEALYFFDLQLYKCKTDTWSIVYSRPKLLYTPMASVDALSRDSMPLTGEVNSRMESYLTRTREQAEGKREWLMLYITLWIIISLATIPLAYRYCRNYLRTHHTSEAIRRGERTIARADRTDNLISMKTLFLGFVGVMSFLMAIFYVSIAYQRNVKDRSKTKFAVWKSVK